MPLKHLTETAYLILLGLVICAFGFFTSLLPAIPEGMGYWAILLTVAVLYPLIFSGTFRTNRADYEFRLLHWFPAGMLILWLILQLIAPHYRPAYILQLGFFFLWSLPLVALGISFIILFAVHVIRRSVVRIWVLSILLVLFCVGAVAAEAQRWNPRLQAAIFPKDTKVFIASVKSELTKLSRLVYQPNETGTGMIAGTAGSSSSARSGRPIAVTPSNGSIPSSLDPSTEAFLSSVRAATNSSSSMVSSMSSSRPSRLPQSGPEAAAILFVFTAAGYCSVMQRKMRKSDLRS